jgi:hypothetical protein
MNGVKAVPAGAARNSICPWPVGTEINVGFPTAVHCWTSSDAVFPIAIVPCAKAIVGARIRTTSEDTFFINLFFLLSVFTTSDGV